jgi:hypothetical protein
MQIGCVVLDGERQELRDIDSHLGSLRACERREGNPSRARDLKRTRASIKGFGNPYVNSSAEFA